MLELTHIRCSTLILRMAGVTILTDPWFSLRMWWVLPALRRPAIPINRVPRPDVILLSHLHPDHFDRRAVRRIFSRDGDPIRVVGPHGTARRLPARKPAALVTELAPGESVEIGRVRLHAVRALHAPPEPNEINFVLEPTEDRDCPTFFFGGDARYGEELARVGARFRIDLAILPVGGTVAFGRRTTMSPEECVLAARDLRAGAVIPIHEGGDWISLPPLSRHRGRAAAFSALASSGGERFATIVPGRGQWMRFRRNESAPGIVADGGPT